VCHTQQQQLPFAQSQIVFFVMAAVFKLSSTSTLLEIVFVSHCAKAS
jgi:hypothetical protein